MADEVSNKIEEAAQGPKRVSSDGVSVEGHSLADQIAADKYLAAKKASRTTRFPGRFAKVKPPGAA